MIFSVILSARRGNCRRVNSLPSFERAYKQREPPLSDYSKNSTAAEIRNRSVAKSAIIRVLWFARRAKGKYPVNISCNIILPVQVWHSKRVRGAARETHTYRFRVYVRLPRRNRASPRKQDRSLRFSNHLGKIIARAYISMARRLFRHRKKITARTFMRSRDKSRDSNRDGIDIIIECDCGWDVTTFASC